MTAYDPTAYASRESVSRMSKDLRAAASTLTEQEARYFVDTYYALQESRITSDARSREASKSGEPHEITVWLADSYRLMEQQAKSALAKYVDAHPVGPWLTATRGVGPVIAAGMLAHIDIERSSSPSAIWRFAGLDPTVKWEKGKKRPWNADLKRLCWILGESFVKVGPSKPRVTGDADGKVYTEGVSSPYNDLYAKRKAYEIARNERGGNAETAKKQLAAKNYGKSTEAYKALIKGVLPDGQIHLRAERYAVKIFLSHLWQEWREITTGKPARGPWIIAHGGHSGMIERFHTTTT